MKNFNTGDKSPAIVAFENQLKSLAAEFMATKENIAETAVAKFEAKPSAGEAQNLLRIAKIFPSKSLAKFAEQLGNAKKKYDLAVSKSKNGEATVVKPQDTDMLVSTQFKPGLQTLINDYQYLLNDLVITHNQTLTHIDKYANEVVMRYSNAYSNAYKTCTDILSAHKDVLTSAANASAALWSVICNGVLSTCSTIGATAKIGAIIAPDWSSKHTTNFALGINVAEDVLQISADKILTTNLTVSSSNIIGELPLVYQNHMIIQFFSIWHKVLEKISKMCRTINAFMKALNDIIKKSGDNQSSMQLKILTAQQEEMAKEVAALKSDISKNLPEITKVNTSDVEKIFLLYLWSKTIPSFKELVEVKSYKIAVGNRYPESVVTLKAVYKTISWTLIDHWKSIGILDKTNCIKEDINFADDYVWNSWNDEIEQLVKWAKCYELPAF